MASILLIGPDPETREMLKLRFELDGLKVATALGKPDALAAIKKTSPDCALIDLIDLSDDEIKEALAITRALKSAKSQSILLMPRGWRESSPKKSCETCKISVKTKLLEADMVVKKPYDLNSLAAQIKRFINSPKTSCSSRRGSRPRS